MSLFHRREFEALAFRHAARRRRSQAVQEMCARALLAQGLTAEQVAELMAHARRMGDNMRKGLPPNG